MADFPSAGERPRLNGAVGQTFRGCTCSRRLVSSWGLGGGMKRLKDGVDTRLLLRYKMEDDGTGVISLPRGCPRGVVVRGLRVIM